jgi:hypothetical protein
VNLPNPPVASDGRQHDGDSVPSDETRYLACGDAALTLIECLMVALIEHRILTTQAMVDAVEAAIAAKRQMVADDEHPEIASAAAGVLSTLANSLAAAKLQRPGRPP